MSQLHQFIDFAVHCARLAGEAILPYFRASPEVHNKAPQGKFDPVTAADRMAEAVVRREIERVYPDHGIHGEEQGVTAGRSPYTWFIDPIDGTRAFMLGHLHWGTLLALNDGSRPILGLMHQPYTGETFIGSQLGGEFRHGDSIRPLKTRATSRIEEVVLCSTDPAMLYTPHLKDAFDRLATHVRAVRWGGDCYTPCMVAAGSTELVVETGLKLWDVQPLIPIVEAAGGVISDWNGGPADRSDKVVIAANRELHQKVLRVMGYGG
jgi:myo-inositol-1(or 4)-monophosphatase